MPIKSVRNIFIFIPVGFIEYRHFDKAIKDTY